MRGWPLRRVAGGEGKLPGGLQPWNAVWAGSGGPSPVSSFGQCSLRGLRDINIGLFGLPPFCTSIIETNPASIADDRIQFTNYKNH